MNNLLINTYHMLYLKELSGLEVVPIFLFVHNEIIG